MNLVNTGLSLGQKMALYRDTAIYLRELEEEILEEAIETEDRPAVDGVAIKDSKGRGSYDWKWIVECLKIDGVINDAIIDAYTTIPAPRINWKKAAEHVGVPAELKEEAYTPGTPSTRLVLT